MEFLGVTFDPFWFGFSSGIGSVIMLVAVFELIDTYKIVRK